MNLQMNLQNLKNLLPQKPTQLKTAALKALANLPSPYQTKVIKSMPTQPETISSRLHEIAGDENDPEIRERLIMAAAEAEAVYIQRQLESGELTPFKKLRLINKYSTPLAIVQSAPYEVEAAVKRHYGRKMPDAFVMKVFTELKGAPRANEVIRDVMPMIQLEIAPGPSLRVTAPDAKENIRIGA
jgi:hypothetical protein